MVVATYNVHRCVGVDGRFDPERTLAVLRELDADVVALQELQWDPDEALHLLETFARRLGCTGLAGPTLLDGHGHYGNALLTRLPVIERRLIALGTFRGREPRGAIDAALDSAGGRVRVVATHLGLRARERRVQLERLLAQTDDAGDETVVLAGDLNAWRPGEWTLRALRDRFGHTPAPATYPSRIPLLALDRIHVRPRGRLRAVEAHATSLSRRASDHLPLRAAIAA